MKMVSETRREPPRVAAVLGKITSPDSVATVRSGCRSCEAFHHHHLKVLKEIERTAGAMACVTGDQTNPLPRRTKQRADDFPDNTSACFSRQHAGTGICTSFFPRQSLPLTWAVAGQDPLLSAARTTNNSKYTLSESLSREISKDGKKTRFRVRLVRMSRAVNRKSI